MINKITLLVLLLSIHLMTCNQCKCLNGGECVSQDGKQYCKCKDDYLGADCSIKGTKIDNNTERQYNLTQQINYFYGYFDENNKWYLATLSYCPKKNVQGMSFTTTIYLQNQEGSLQIDQNSYLYHDTQKVPTQNFKCQGFHSNIKSPQNKSNGLKSKIIAKIVKEQGNIKYTDPPSMNIFFIQRQYHSQNAKTVILFLIIICVLAACIPATILIYKLHKNKVNSELLNDQNNYEQNVRVEQSQIKSQNICDTQKVFYSRSQQHHYTSQNNDEIVEECMGKKRVSC